MQSILCALVVVSALVVGGAACQKSEPAAAPAAPPSPVLVEAMRDFCKIGELAEDKRLDAMKLWAYHHNATPEVGPVWTRAAAKQDPAAIATLVAAAAVAVGPGNCAMLDPVVTPGARPAR